MAGSLGTYNFVSSVLDENSCPSGYLVVWKFDNLRSKFGDKQVKELGEVCEEVNAKKQVKNEKWVENISYNDSNLIVNIGLKYYYEQYDLYEEFDKLLI
ncbi:hypothetical protein RclHR1_09750006 [Rhizophagus clarus]|uniref:Uncharacterized protein n=1 Tax=Rhizophagus clarus TaxID=94130 RepID=A0A2Z6SR76_9GLOM|nr:hypothetical protein RclHR1_09750006 [Rhizophagus clarus]